MPSSPNDATVFSRLLLDSCPSISVCRLERFCDWLGCLFTLIAGRVAASKSLSNPAPGSVFIDGPRTEDPAFLFPGKTDPGGVSMLRFGTTTDGCEGQAGPRDLGSIGLEWSLCAPDRPGYGATWPPASAIVGRSSAVPDSGSTRKSDGDT